MYGTIGVRPDGRRHGVGMLVLLAVVAGLAYLAWRLVLAAESSADAPEAMRVLETLYARGEVDDEEFERRRDRLGAEP